jgi:formylglycine-generating enzyme required for sulfatase activity
MGVFELWEPMDPGYNANNLYRNSLAHYFLPSIDEWHKAAYYDPIAGVYYDYPTGSDAIPDGIDFVGDPNFQAVFAESALNPQPNSVFDVGLLSPYGTTGQGGNVDEWQESAFDRINDMVNDQRGSRGGAWVSHSNLLAAWNSGGGVLPVFESNAVGFRITSVVPEPTKLLFCCFGVVLLSPIRIRRDASK